MEAGRWEKFAGWLFDNGIVKDRSGAVMPRIDSQALFTNDLLAS